MGKVTNKLGLSCAKLRSVELKLENNKILGLNEIGMRDIKGKKSRDDKSVVGHNFWMSLAKTKQWENGLLFGPYKFTDWLSPSLNFCAIQVDVKDELGKINIFDG